MPGLRIECTDTLWDEIFAWQRKNLPTRRDQEVRVRVVEVDGDDAVLVEDPR